MCIVALHCILALCCIVFLGLLFSVVLALCCFPRPLQPYYTPICSGQQFVGQSFSSTSPLFFLTLGPQDLLLQILAASVPSTAPVSVDEIAAAIAQSISSVLLDVLSSLQSTSTAISSSSLSAASVSSQRSDLHVPEHTRMSVGPPISSPHTSSVSWVFLRSLIHSHPFLPFFLLDLWQFWAWFHHDWPY